MIISPDLIDLQYREIHGVKYFELVAQEIKQEILPGLFIKAWGYNGSTPGPTIQVYPGDFVNIRVYNKLPEPTSVHWHGLDVPNVMDGVPEVEPSPLIEPGSFFDYRFRIVNPPGTHMYHTHFISHKQQMMGLEGGFIIQDPSCKELYGDYFYMLQEFMIDDLPMEVVRQGIYDINPMAHDFNFFTMNGRCYPYTSPMDVPIGSKIRIRLSNSMMDAHPIHLHGHQFIITAADGNSFAPSNVIKKSTVNVASGETWDIEIDVNNPGVWPFHCHIPHHMSNNMTEPSGGMFTVLDVRY